MLVALLCLVAAQPQESFPKGAPYKDRAGFYKALANVHEGMPAAEIRRLLGSPDDVISDHFELGGVTADQLWSYGTDKHLGFPTLGQVSIVRGKSYWSWTGSGKPYVARMPEAALRAILRKLAGEDRGKYDHTAWMVRTANALIDLGQVKAGSALEEFHRVTPIAGPWDTLEPLERLIYDVPKPPGSSSPQPNILVRELKPRFRKGPRFPMIVFDDIPFEVSLGGFVGSYGSPRAPTYPHYPIRTKRLRPPDDPFASCARLIASDQWPFPEHSKDDERFRIPYKENEGDAMRQVLSLVFDVYQPVDYRVDIPGNGFDLEKFHRGFLKVRAHWDDQRQRYVREDGVTLPELHNPKQQTWTPRDFNHEHLICTLERHGNSSYVNAGFEGTSQGKGPRLPEVFRVVDATSGKVLLWIQVSPPARSVPAGPPTRTAESFFLAGASERGDGWGGSCNCGITLPVGRPVRIELATRAHTERSPVLKP